MTVIIENTAATECTVDFGRAVLVDFTDVLPHFEVQYDGAAWSFLLCQDGLHRITVQTTGDAVANVEILSAGDASPTRWVEQVIDMEEVEGEGEAMALLRGLIRRLGAPSEIAHLPLGGFLFSVQEHKLMVNGQPLTSTRFIDTMLSICASESDRSIALHWLGAQILMARASESLAGYALCENLLGCQFDLAAAAL